MQIVGDEYLQRVGTTSGDSFAAVDAAPDFQGLLQDLQRGTYHTSNSWVPLPSEYMFPATPPPAGTAGGTAGTATTGDGTVISELTEATGTRSATTQTRQVNTTTDADFTGLTFRGTLGLLLRANRPPPQ